MQSGTSGVGPSTGKEDGRIGAAGPGTNESSATELRRKMKRVKLPGNEHFSLVDEEDERKVNCDLFPFPEEEYAQIPGEEDGAKADLLPMDEERSHIIHTLAGPHLLPVKFGAQATAALRSMRPGDMLQLSRSRPIAPGSKICKT